LDTIKASLTFYGIEDFYFNSARNIQLSYYGKLNDWKTYLSLGDRYLPRWFKTKTFRLNSKGHLDLRFNELGFKFSAERLSEDSSILAKVGLSPYSPQRQEFQGLTLLKRFDKAEFYEVAKIFRPSQQASKESKIFWKDLVQGRSPFNGKAYSRSGSHFVHLPMGPNGAAGPSGRKPAQQGRFLYLASCVKQSDKEKASVQKHCQLFIRGLSQ